MSLSKRRDSLAIWILQSGRTVGDVAADCSGISHLQTADPSREFAKVGVQARQGPVRIRVTHSRTDRDRFGRLLDPREIRDIAKEDHRFEIPEALRHPKADVGGSGNHSGIRIFGKQRCKFVTAARSEPAAPVAAAGRAFAGDRLQPVQ